MDKIEKYVPYIAAILFIGIIIYFVRRSDNSSAMTSTVIAPDNSQSLAASTAMAQARLQGGLQGFQSILQFAQAEEQASYALKSQESAQTAEIRVAELNANAALQARAMDAATARAAQRSAESAQRRHDNTTAIAGIVTAAIGAFAMFCYHVTDDYEASRVVYTHGKVA